MKTKFNYRATVIIPIFNRGDMVHIAFESLLAQTIPFEQVQVLIVNDGSTDDSLSVCRKLAEPYNNVKVLDKPNGGVSSARNFGLKNAEGKYIIYLDDDDMISPETIQNLCDFFDTCYDEVDLVTYGMAVLRDNVVRKSTHFRYKHLTETGVYDLEEVPAAVQTTINVCVKNRFEENILFDESLHYMEDQAYNNSVLSEKLKIGFCKEAEYIYNRHGDSAVALSSSPIKCFEFFVSYFENLFAGYEKVPVYFQCSLLHNLSYRMKDNILFPYHYSKEDFSAAMDRISDLLSRVDEITLYKLFPMDDFYKTYFYSLKKNKKAYFEFSPEQQRLMLDEETVLMSRESVTFVARRFYFDGNKVRFIGYIRTPFFYFIDKPKLFINYSDGRKPEEIELKVSSFNYYYCEHECAKNWFFDFTIDCNKTFDFYFTSQIEDTVYPCTYEFNTLTVSKPNKSGFIFLKKSTRIQLKDNVFHVKKISKIEYYLRNLKRIIHLFLLSPKLGVSFVTASIMKKDEIWLYNDNLFTVKDNAYYQFKHDFAKKDGVKRYFILDGDPSRMEGLFTEEEKKNVVTFASAKHKLLYLACSKIITSFCEYSSFCPLIPKHKRMFFDLIDSEVIYLQHGILHATTPTKYSRDRVMVDKVVVSSHFELKNFTEKYGYSLNDLIPTGMARYDHTDTDKKPQKKILYAPSWRDKLVGKYVNRKRVFNDSVLVKSNYYKGIVAFLTNPELLKALEKHDVTIEFKPHPNFTAYSHLFEPFLNERIVLAERNVQLEDYSLFITDFSSFNFDFLYQNRQLLYFVPDYDEFRCGAVTFYRDIDIPFEEGFGDYAFNPEDAAALTIKRIECNFETDEKYRKRIDNFFISKKNHCEQLYNYLTEKQ